MSAKEAGIRHLIPLNKIFLFIYNMDIKFIGQAVQGGVTSLIKALREGAAYNQKDIIDFLSEFSLFKDRVERKFKDVASELKGKNNEHQLWVSLYLIATDYAEEWANKRQKQQPENNQKVS